jgi:hypothetical protein
MSRTSLAPAEDSPRIRTGSELVRYIAAVGIAGLVTGIAVGGIGSRVFMRIAAAAAADAAQGASTEADAIVGAITFDGTMGIVIFVGVGAGIAGAVFYATFRPWLSWTGRFRGLAFGVVLLAVGSATSDALNPDNFDFTLLENRALVVSMIVLLFLGFGLVMEGLFRILDRRLPATDGHHRKAHVVYGVITGLGVAVMSLTIPALLFARANCDCDPPIIASSFVVMAAVGTLVSWASDIGARSDRSFAIARILGMSGLAGACLFGLWRAGSDAISILTASS